MERKGRTTIRRQRRSRSWLFSPMIIAQLAVVMALVGAGVSFALTSSDITTTTTPPWAGHATIGDGSLAATNYELQFDAGLQNVTGIKVTIKNNGTAPHNGSVQIAIDHAGAPVAGTAAATVTNLGIGESVTTSTITLTSSVPIGPSLDTLRIIVTQTN